MKPFLFLFITITLLFMAQYGYASSYQPTNIALQQIQNPDTLQRYVGAYEVAPGHQLTISLIENTLYVLPPNETTKAALKQISDSEFVVIGEEARLLFKKELTGQIQSVEIHFGNGASAVGRKL